jgi:hypothetical protein
MTITKKRTQLLLELENLIGNECYNGNIQNWGAGGVFEGEGREFRYPITFIDEAGGKIKKRMKDSSILPVTVITGHYTFGANQLHIMRGLDRVLRYLEEHHGLKL